MQVPHKNRFLFCQFPVECNAGILQAHGIILCTPVPAWFEWKDKAGGGVHRIAVKNEEVMAINMEIQ